MRRARVAVELDGVRWRVLPVDAVVRIGLRAGRQLDRPLARELARELRRCKALQAAGRALRTRDLSAQELDERLARRGVGAAARAEAVAALERGGLVDDARYAHARAETMAHRGYGDAAIRADLERRGVPIEAVAGALAALEPEPARARRLLERDGRGLAAARRLAARGFGEEAVETAFGDFIAGDGC